jgi:hypothetical protein
VACRCQDRHCQALSAFDPVDISDCGYFVGDNRSICYSSLAKKLHDSSICERINDTYRKNDCLFKAKGN